MYRQDMAEENGEIEPFPIDDVIDKVCEWNYDLILHAEAKKDDPKDFQEYCEFQEKYDSLKADESVLDRLFDKTSHAKELLQRHWWKRLSVIWRARVIWKRRQPR